jgi:ferredoxin
MFFHPASKNRSFHLGPFPLEVLERDPAIVEREAARAPVRVESEALDAGRLGTALTRYRDVFIAEADGPAAPEPAPLPDDLARQSEDIKGGAYFMDASMVGICRLPVSARGDGIDPRGHDHAIVVLVEHPRAPEADNLAHGWVGGAVADIAAVRAGEIAAISAGHIRWMGFSARAHMTGACEIDMERLAVLAGLVQRAGAAEGGGVSNPFLGRDFALAVVTTDYPMAVDAPLSARAVPHPWAYWWGINGAQSGRERTRRARRATHLSRYPMETVKRVDRPTTLILDDEVPRVPKRAAFFERALKGDLGAKSQAERNRFATKHPFSASQRGMIRAMVPHQDGPVAASGPDTSGDPAANARAVKSLSYLLGSDLTGICEIPDYAWYSHREDGGVIQPYHRTAIVMLIDQGYDTMEGASGDDWISGAQSMRSYLRGAEIAGVMAEVMRGLGHAARSQTNADSDVLHIPLVLLAGLGELSRIGELVLNPFVGPRFKSVVVTTDMPLAPDKPIDFGLQAFCNGCLKCARECPCDAIPFGDKVMFNGYEMWKPDVERCTRYRLTNIKGSACGRCMKTCPINKVVDAEGALLTRAASWMGVNAMWAKPVMVPVAAWFDDAIGNGKRSPG